MSKTPALSQADSDLKYHLINKYRELISHRYDTVIRNIDKAPVALKPAVAKDIKDFFLEHVYPEPAERRKLDAAFAELEKFVTTPSLVWGLIGSLPMAILQFGAHLPSAIKAGMKSLEAYTSAIGFESSMLQAAIDKGYTIPLTDEQFIDCLKNIPREKLENFITEASVLFTVISNTTLLSKTILIMEDVIKRMKSKPNLYNEDQISAIRMGLDLMQKGYELLSPYDDETKHAIISFIATTEVNFIAEIHGK
ncbi:MAG: hypothetical protein JWO03_567 [Bacteroidetes bacterium]|nr:hypothetical protein [Bacteroidota bacterium]